NFAFATFEHLSPLITKVVFQDPTVVLHRDGYLYFNGFEGPGQIEIYSIIGNKIFETSTQDLFQFKLISPLESGNMYIIRVNSNGIIKTFKIVSS
ncbi:T9SS type A sorting domain-containing protein, partial [Flavobacteriaceae bacterium]|nr:T9SS type A sorting domain-containing protein [Flavobacteriaceae bacterium]